VTGTGAFLIARGGVALSVPAAKSKLPHVAIHGAFLNVTEAGTLMDAKASMLKRNQRCTTP
jgi:hypothetical protein